MEQLSETARVDRELEEAHRDLRETLEEVNHKVERVEARLRPRAIMRSNPVTLTLVAGVLGFVAGSDRQARPLRSVIVGSLLGAVVVFTRRGSKKRNDGTS
jgi:hypothetical protein